MQALLALLSVCQLTLSEGEEERRSQTKTRGEVTAILTKSAIQSFSLESWLESKVRLGCVKELQWIWVFVFPLAGSVHLMQVKRWIWSWFHKTLSKFLRNAMGCAKVEDNCFFLLFIINYRCVHEGYAWVEYESWTFLSQLERLLQGWSKQWACLFMLSGLFSTCCCGMWMERWARKEGLFWNR